MTFVNFQEPVANIMTRSVLTVTPKDLMEKVRTIFENNNIHHIPVIDLEEKVVGIISKQDFMQILHGFTLFKTPKSDEYNESMLRALLVQDVMTKRLVTLNEKDTVSIAIDIFKENLFHALPVVDQNGKLKGILTTYDLLTFFSNPVRNIE